MTEFLFSFLKKKKEKKKQKKNERKKERKKEMLFSALSFSRPDQSMKSIIDNNR